MGRRKTEKQERAKVKKNRAKVRKGCLIDYFKEDLKENAQNKQQQKQKETCAIAFLIC